ncbi:hypothetical protein ABFS83_11G023600 [Erythranthe nasuta]
MYVDHGSSLGGDDDGLALFIGTNHSFAILAKDYPEGFVKPDSIYFTDVLRNDFDNDELDYGGHDIGIFSYRDRSFSPCYYPSDAKSFQRISPSPIRYTPTPPPLSSLLTKLHETFYNRYATYITCEEVLLINALVYKSNKHKQR